MKIKDFVEKIGYRKLSLSIIAILIVALGVWGIKGTHAFYSYSSGPIQIFNSKVGNFAGKGDTSPLTGRTTDINVLYYVQDITDPKKYSVMVKPPLEIKGFDGKTGFTIDQEKSNCIPKNGASYPADNGSNNGYKLNADGTVRITVTQSSANQVVCRLYYTFADDLNDGIILFAMKQDEHGNVSYNNNKYSIVSEIPSEYTYKGYKCTDQTASSFIKYDASTGFTFTTNKPNVCYAYFDKN